MVNGVAAQKAKRQSVNDDRLPLDRFTRVASSEIPAIEMTSAQLPSSKERGILIDLVSYLTTRLEDPTFRCKLWRSGRR